MSMPDNRIPQKGGEERAITRLKLMHALGVTTTKSLDCGILAVGQLLTNGQEKEGGKIVSIGLSSNGGSLVVLTNAGDLFHVTEWDNKKGKTQKSSAASRKISIDTKNSKQLNVSGEFSDSDSEGVLKEIPPVDGVGIGLGKFSVIRPQ
ncbi:hypothetical protein Pmar_PMAR000195 [Perkinsus marinus ATCC 50983]|uniref:Uncharacterized protein n=1 Tax=Perkinsus marinus (strain ATCC 50983 / TXsc) TaxID=423536 RepID=C5K8Q5_PERM5|nr:hypothetical protein Pmar_PMAR000195 [Perkinsus marinus ATCC 50983]EER19132.1 hypothetical protein Pmar_PMAR000195 [Perkinsus marinus ATCC 50983]|eukprot:XP_002787336.1 hypothetical protein Pmar_PMAR000195 [Perkinsus marinus ATCC 50983]